MGVSPIILTAPSLKLTNMPLKMDGWNTIITFLLGFGLFLGAFAVVFREGTFQIVRHFPLNRHDYGRKSDFEYFPPNFWGLQTWAPRHQNRNICKRPPKFFSSQNTVFFCKSLSRYGKDTFGNHI